MFVLYIFYYKNIYIVRFCKSAKINSVYMYYHNDIHIYKLCDE